MTHTSNISIQFLGASGTVTGSKYYIQTPTKKILVDCGLFQGLKELRELNWNNLPIDASTIDLVLLTHGHLDHCGYLPRLVNEGFSGEIWGTMPTLEVAQIILEDSARIQEEDAERANNEGFTRHRPAKPLYGSEDVENTTPLFVPQDIDHWIRIDENIHCRFRYNSHIIGACFIELKIGEKTIVFSGDIGRDNDLLMYPPKHPEQADVVLIESTYGDRLHPQHPEKRLMEVINSAYKKHGTIIIPSFAVERTQMLMYLLWKLRENGDIPNIPVYMDSPMGTNVLGVFERHAKWHKLPPNECKEMLKDIRQIRTIQDTNRLIKSDEPKIVIAGSGMASGGRVLSYFAHYLGNSTATILLVGFQAEGTRGRALLEGASEVKLYGKYFQVRASVENIEGLSSHADQAGLIDWLSKLKSPKVYIIHGELSASEALQAKIKEVYGWDAIIPKLNQVEMV
jgi:metallo-beta-lactamase family protein